jgi:hypothetical protein
VPAALVAIALVAAVVAELAAVAKRRWSRAWWSPRWWRSTSTLPARRLDVLAELVAIALVADRAGGDAVPRASSPRWSPSSNHRTLATGGPARPGALAVAMLVADRGRGRRAARPRRARRLDAAVADLVVAEVVALDLDVLAALVAIALVADSVDGPTLAEVCGRGGTHWRKVLVVLSSGWPRWLEAFRAGPSSEVGDADKVETLSWMLD